MAALPFAAYDVAYRFVEHDCIGLRCKEWLSIKEYRIAIIDRGADSSWYAVDCHPPVGDGRIGCTPAQTTCEGYEFIAAHKASVTDYRAMLCGSKSPLGAVGAGAATGVVAGAWVVGVGAGAGAGVG